MSSDATQITPHPTDSTSTTQKYTHACHRDGIRHSPTRTHAGQVRRSLLIAAPRPVLASVTIAVAGSDRVVIEDVVVGEREALLSAVLNSPSDDTTRLVFADWLEENGEVEFGRFLRAGVVAAKYRDRRVVEDMEFYHALG